MSTVKQRVRRAQQIGKSNALMALDEAGGRHATLGTSIAAYEINAVDTCNDRGLDPVYGLMAFYATLDLGWLHEGRARRLAEASADAITHR